MAATEEKSLQAKEKAEVSTPVEYTKPGVVFLPAVDIYETEKAITILADMPGVKADDLTVDLRDNVLTLDGEVKTPEVDGERELLREYRTGRYYRQFTLSQVIDQQKIEADLKNGVLKVNLPKVEVAVPRRISVNAG
ncbi:MAG TPA: Hsp20/alpha crystallin family protein [Desulfobacteraceae bacterium]|jgi:HSP20 family protein|nr:Hsp20/alpha crystallin family protein [Desulfobacteraceae bacterium]